MNSALKPVLPQPGVPQPGGQSSPAKANVANANHAVGHPQGAQNSLHHPPNNMVGQNLIHHAPAPPLPSHAVPSMAPVSANMAQMAQNMSHHGNLSHLNQNSVPAPSIAPSPSKATGSPLSLVQEKANTSQPLALTRTPEKKEPDSTGQANGTIDSPKSGSSAPATLKPQNPETNKDKQDIAKTSPSTPKPPEKVSSASSTPQKPESSNPVSQADGPAQPKVATANEAPEKSPCKPTEMKPAPAGDVAPTQSDSKPPETANANQIPDKAPTPPKQETVATESAKIEQKPEEVKEEAKVEKPAEDKKEAKDQVDGPKKEEQTDKPQTQKIEEKVEEKKLEAKPVKAEAKPKSTLKLATVTTPMRKRRQTSPSKGSEGPSPAKRVAEGDSTPDSRAKRNRTKVQLYQSPTPELAMATKLSASAGRSTPTKQNDDKLIVFYKNEYLAVRNAEGGFYVCQTTQNVYRTTRKIKIRWLSQDKSLDPSGEVYKPDFYDVTDMECVITTLSLSRAPSGGGAQVLSAAEQARARSILERALRAEQSGANNIELTEEHPDGLDLSLYTDESQLEKKTRKRNSSKSSPRTKPDVVEETAKKPPTPIKKARTTPKRSPKRKKPSNKTKTQTNKRKPAGSTPIVGSSSKTATAVTEKAKAKSTPPKRTPTKPATPVTTPLRKGRRSAAKEAKSSPIVPTPSTSTGKATRTPRKPPANK
ncbi:hypothetical protein K1T71_001473 [Dendrolimus kikuchii]|uniref:Uncharacterized protein n=1 Tax=Dendrolimus kikuchii TaxID=765133 RepID=A0ACC1DHX4_9NEOP|nr:hypothetical protein K1T71_001473 [Dendrolimus kikuchii]